MNLFEACVPACRNILDTLDVLLSKAAAHCESTRCDPAVLLAARLAPDMFAFTRQVQIASDGAKLASFRLAGLEAPSQPDTEDSIASLQARVAATRAMLLPLAPPQFEDSATRAIAIPAGGNTLRFTGANYLFRFARPNTYFHLTAAYAILRHQGVALTKRDYLPPLV